MEQSPNESDTCDKCGLHKNECRCSRGKVESPSEEGKETRNIIKFLLGEEPFDGYWYGDKTLDKRPPFWWRNHLRKYIEELEKGDQEELWNEVLD